MYECVNISKIYPSSIDTSEVAALKNITITITRGEFLAITGPSGSGKSTLLNILGLLDDPSSGQLYIDKQPAPKSGSRKASDLRGGTISFIFQRYNLFPELSALDNLLIALKYSKRPINRKLAMSALDDVGLIDRMNHKPRHLSGGEQQRIAIARSLVVEPNIILADEPTGSLPSAMNNEIINLFKKINSRGTTVIIVTHNEYIAKEAKSHLMLYDGCLNENQF